MFTKKIMFLFFNILLFFQFENLKGQKSYNELEKAYENFDSDDEKALKYVNVYLIKAKKENNYIELKQAYEDYSYYSSNLRNKRLYADSAITAAIKSEEKDLSASAYLYKGSIYYYYDKNYQSALQEYLKAYEYSKSSTDDYLKNKIVYQTGLVKSYLGYYNEAIEHFTECIKYFEPRTKGNHHKNTIYNSTKGYLNSLHQIVVCYRHLQNYKKVDSIINVGLMFPQIDNFSIEKSYFTKCKGISEYNHKNYNSSINLLNKNLPKLIKQDDFYWTAVSEFYIGKSYMALGKEDSAIKQFEKVDSVFQKRRFILPELLENYNFLIKYYQSKKNTQKELEYSKKLLKADSMLNRDFKNLSAKIHKDYDRKILEESKDKLEKQNRLGLGTILILLFALLFAAFLAWKYYNYGKQIKSKYLELEKKLTKLPAVTASLSYESISKYGKSVISEDVFTDLQKKLEYFEKNNEFNEKGLSLVLLAEKLNTNTSYLSQYINDTKGMNFNKYLSTLRINYITRQMYNDPKYLLLKIQGLADECGIGSRQNFSDLFQEINGIRPTDFIKQRKAELEKNFEDPIIADIINP